MIIKLQIARLGTYWYTRKPTGEFVLDRKEGCAFLSHVSDYKAWYTNGAFTRSD